MRGAARGGAVGGSSLHDAGTSLRATQGKQREKVCRWEKRKEKKGNGSSEHKTRATQVTDKPPYFKYLVILTPFFVTTREAPESMVTLIVTSAV